jgi:hypothetical protein
VRYASSAYAGHLIGIALGAALSAPLAIALKNPFILSMGTVVSGGLGLVAGYGWERHRERAGASRGSGRSQVASAAGAVLPSSRKPRQGAGTSLEPGRLLDGAVTAGAGLRSLQPYLYPSVVGATPAQRAVISAALESLPLRAATSPTVISVTDVRRMGPWGVAQPLYSQSRILLDRGALADPELQKIVPVHEIGHTFDYLQGVGPWGNYSSGPGGFGEGPYVSRYARTNRPEDFAESFRVFHTDPELLRRRAPAKFAALEEAHRQGLVEEALDRPQVRAASRRAADALGAVPLLRETLALASALLSPLQIHRGARDLQAGLATGDRRARLDGKMRLATGLLLFSPTTAPLGLAAGLAHQWMAGNPTPAGEALADGLLAAAAGPVGMASLAALTELRRAGIDLEAPAPPASQRKAPEGLPYALAGAAAGSLAGALLGTSLGGLAGGLAWATWGHLAGAGAGWAGWKAFRSLAQRPAGPSPGPDPTELTPGDKVFLTGVLGGAAVGGLAGGYLGGRAGSAAGSAAGAALFGPAGAVTGALLGRALGSLTGSYALARGGAWLGRALTGA